MRAAVVLMIVLTSLIRLEGQTKKYPLQNFDQQKFARSLDAFVAASPSGFASFRGDKMTGRGEKWEANPSMPGAYFCDVDWNGSNDPKSKADLICDYGEGLTGDEAADSYAALKSAVMRATTAKGWKGMYRQGDDTMTLFKPPAGVDSGWLSVWLQADGGTYRLFFSIDSTKTPSELTSTGSSASNEPVMQTWVAQDIREYVEASRTNFEAYKGEPTQAPNGNRAWISKQKPALAVSCFVIENGTNLFTCELSRFKSAQEAEDGYNRLIGFVAHAIPSWTRKANPFASEYRSTAFLTSGLEGEVWLHSEQDKGEWTLHYQLLKR